MTDNAGTAPMTERERELYARVAALEATIRYLIEEGPLVAPMHGLPGSPLAPYLGHAVSVFESSPADWVMIDGVTGDERAAIASRASQLAASYFKAGAAKAKTF